MRNMGYSHLGHIIENAVIHHATVLHACKTVADLMEIDKSFRNSIKEIEEILKKK